MSQVMYSQYAPQGPEYQGEETEQNSRETHQQNQFEDVDPYQQNLLFVNQLSEHKAPTSMVTPQSDPNQGAAMPAQQMTGQTSDESAPRVDKR